ncbi:uncharacterized protein Z520_01727 [Fonsecaea multimorphosa CBS 102226]|uniref:Carboxylic ester hydrolase n=1 Tax=Fonsecaea multimorphosa CBS 102226 TaxID=1442371 RepID=A0A0D2KIF4_9EURO|nr:uncharacterized protein Z520_01727 [Fonsecaea multimorphosa CBS 102226]KIY03260.1 hypothetical protein Z520_01727 [Fonsecaea multimorphosa CBS 102226]OAL30179.1 hypothetical protein AYO22_01695 [Fonsecaea multimorphosa]
MRPALVLGCLSTVLATNDLVRLEYTSYKGTALPNGITQWLGMRYAAPPTGSLRFAAPQDPPVTDDIRVADKHGALCFGTGSNAHDPTLSEDCLFLDVYAPSRATNTSSLPVYFFIQGGGFNFNSNSNHNGSGLITTSGHGLIVVTFNYRVGPYGTKALEWVQKYISQFGGDPKHVVLGGDSAGAASIAYHLTAYGGRDDGLFVAAAAESVSFAPILTVEESQYQYDNLAKSLGCAPRTASSQDATVKDDTLSCLRSKTTAQFQAQTHNVPPYPGAQNPPLYMWNPVLDNALIQNYTYAAFDNGNFLRVPVLFGDDTNGGTIFTPRGTSSQAQSNTFLHNQFPQLTIDQLQRLDQLYPNNGPQFPNSGSWWRQVSNVYGDMRYMCPNLFISSAYARYGVPQNWNYWYNVADAAQIRQGLGVPHTVELAAIWGPDNIPNGASPASYRNGGPNAWIVPLMQGYWISFIRVLDPNPFRIQGAPMWREFTLADEEGSAGAGAGAGDGDNDGVSGGGGGDWMRMLFDTADTTGMAAVSTAVRKRCQYLNSIGLALKQ